MREIKFRAWDKENGKMLAPMGLWDIRDVGRDDEGGGSIFVNSKYNLYEDSDYIFMQYTGLKDKKRTKEFPDGQEIYEGDILQRKGKEYDGKEFNDIFVATIPEVYMESELEPIMYDVEVIGNIYENKELLETKGRPKR